MSKVRMLVLVGAMIVTVGYAPAAQQPSSSLAGSWTLDSAERIEGERSSAIELPAGLIVFDTAGHVVEIVSQRRRQVYAANQPTSEEALAAFNTFGGFWGTYTVDEKAGRISYRPAAGVHPALQSRELTRRYELAGNRLVMSSSSDEPGFQGSLRTTWRRVPPIENLTPAYRQVLGFWQWQHEGSYLTSTGTAVTEGKRDPSIIVYAPSGHIGVHFVPAGRKAFSETVARAEEARAAIVGYVGYTATLGLYPRSVAHHQLVTIAPGMGATLEREYELRGDELHLRFPPTIIQGQERETRVRLKRLSGAAEMLGR